MWGGRARGVANYCWGGGARGVANDCRGGGGRVWLMQGVWLMTVVHNPFDQYMAL